MTIIDTRLKAISEAGRTMRTSGRSVGEIAIEKTNAAPDHIVVIESGRAISRAELMDAACRLGGALAARGLGSGSVVGFQLPNWWEACVLNLCAALFGYRLVPLLTIYRAAELNAILPACEVEALFVPGQFRGKNFVELVASLPHPPKHIFTIRGDKSSPNEFENLLHHDRAEPTPPKGDDAKMILFTSGSTGKPKGVIHSHASIDTLIRMAADFWQIDHNDKLYIPSPIGHIGGAIYAFEFPWITDCTAILAESWDPDQAVRDIDHFEATFMAGATPFLTGLIAASERANTKLPSLRRFVCGGASVSPELIREGLNRFETAVVSRAYGSTEVPLVCPGARNRQDAERYADTDGECVTDLRLLDEHGQMVNIGASGEIVVRAPWMLLGYLASGDDEDAFVTNDYFLMGDLGRFIDKKYLEITGRSKDIIIRKGENISPLEIENALARHEAVFQSAVIGIPDLERGEMVVAFVVPVQGKTFSFNEMTTHMNELGLAKQKFPEKLEIVSSLPMNSVGKVQKNELKAVLSKFEKQ